MGAMCLNSSVTRSWRFLQSMPLEILQGHVWERKGRFARPSRHLRSSVRHQLLSPRFISVRYHMETSAAPTVWISLLLDQQQTSQADLSYSQRKVAMWRSAPPNSPGIGRNGPKLLTSSCAALMLQSVSMRSTCIRRRAAVDADGPRIPATLVTPTVRCPVLIYLTTTNQQVGWADHHARDESTLVSEHVGHGDSRGDKRRSDLASRAPPFLAWSQALCTLRVRTCRGIKRQCR